MSNKIKCPDCDGVRVFGGGDGKCSDCNGTGGGGILDCIAANIAPTAEAADELRECDTCNGSGVCQTCDGEGYIDE
jgi:hypothetical protein